MLGAALCISTAANGQPAAEECEASFNLAEELLKSDKPDLLRARTLLRACSAPSCGKTLPALCDGELMSLEPRVPSVVFVARRSDGHHILDATVLLGDQVISSLDGKAIELNPGAYDFVFRLSDGTTKPVRAIVAEGAKAQMISLEVTLEQPPPQAPPPPPPPEVAPAPPAPVASSEATARPPQHTSALRPLGYVSLGLGAIGLAAGTVATLVALGKDSSSGCGDDGFCSRPEARRDAIGAADFATWAFVLGGAFIASGITLIVMAPRTPVTAHSVLRVGWGGTTVSLVGGF